MFATAPAPGLPRDYILARIDGGARGNPGPAGYGVLLEDRAGRKLAELSHYLGPRTNNFAEYSGLIAALEYATANPNGYGYTQFVAHYNTWAGRQKVVMRQIHKAQRAQRLALAPGQPRQNDFAPSERLRQFASQQSRGRSRANVHGRPARPRG